MPSKTYSIHVTWELIRNAYLKPYPRLTDLESAFYKDPGEIRIPIKVWDKPL